MRYLRRLVWYIATRLLIILLVLGVLTFSFFYAMNATNIYVIIKDGMAKRAQVILMDESSDSLSSYFTATWLSRDSLLQQSLSGTDEYSTCTVTGIDHRITLHSVWCWPWDSTASATVTEKIPAIDGKTVTGDIPKWQSTKYSVILTKENGNWKIKDLSVLELIADE